jgi:transcriptional regulator with XRE-family HTH domain
MFQCNILWSKIGGDYLNSWMGGVPLVLHHRIVELRKSKKITQEGLSSKIGVSRSALSQYELGSRQPDYEIIKRMADFFGVSTDYLLGVEQSRDRDIHKEETQLDRDKKYALDLIMGITDPDKKKAAIEYLKFLAGDK